VIDEDPERAREALDTWLDSRDGTRGVASYRWLVGLSTRGGECAVIDGGGVKCVVVRNNGRVLMCAAEITNMEESSSVTPLSDFLTEVTSWAGNDVVCGLALPGDRATKNMFEALRMPAQVLLH
jgi:hypothetical protein